MRATLIPPAQINAGVRRHCTVREAAALIGVSESTIRRAARRLGVTRIAGSTVRGGILLDRAPVPVVIAYSQGARP